MSTVNPPRPRKVNKIRTSPAVVPTLSRRVRTHLVDCNTASSASLRGIDREITCPHRCAPCRRFRRRSRSEPYRMVIRKGTTAFVPSSRATSRRPTSTNRATPTTRRPSLCPRSSPVTSRRSVRATRPSGWWSSVAVWRGSRAQSTSQMRVTFPSCSSAGTCSAARYRRGRTRTGIGSRPAFTSSSARTPT